MTRTRREEVPGEAVTSAESSWRDERLVQGAGCHFVTICTRGLASVLGEVVDGQVNLTPAGEVVAGRLQVRRHGLEVFEVRDFVVMPNHLHVVFVPREDSALVTLRKLGGIRVRRSVGLEVLTQELGQLKSWCSRRIVLDGIAGFGWAPRFDARPIRTTRQAELLQNFIASDPQRWLVDKADPLALVPATVATAPRRPPP
jgi:REP element-mobilizing transposase RayT